MNYQKEMTTGTVYTYISCDLLKPFAVGNCKHTSWFMPNPGQLLTHTQNISIV